MSASLLLALLRRAKLMTLAMARSNTADTAFSSDLESISKPVVAIDLDNTLIFSTLIKTNETTFSVKCNDQRNRRHIVNMHIQVRPNAIDFLEKIGVYYEVYFFTALERDFALKVILNISPLTGENHILSKESCIFENGYAVKDLTLLRKENLDRVLLVDDVLGSGLHQPMNCIGVASWEGEPDDDVLMMDLLPFLIECGREDNVVRAVRKKKEENRIPENLSLY